MTEAQAIPAELSPIEDIVGQGKAVGDWLRASILQVLHQESYSVSELCKLFDVPQPALSHHLKILLQAGLVARRREGNSIFYRRASLAADSVGAALLSGLDRAELDRNLHQRINTIHQTRNQRSADFFARNAAEISAEQAQISEPGTYVDSVLEMLAEATDEGAAIHEVLEVGPGGGEMLTQLAALFDGVTGVDTSASMLDAAKKATVDWPGVRLLHQDFLTLQANAASDAPPFDAPPFHAIVAAMVVHHQASPASFLATLNHARPCAPKSSMM
ncbi:MAG: metalloregulator ArsR/SmtB family transcription factor [Pseudomonadales bacterium]